MKRRTVLILAGLAIILLVGFGRLRIDVDVFNLLPIDSRMVDGLKLYQQSFGTSRELIIALRSPDASQTERAARSLAGELGRSDLTTRVVWRSPFREDPAALGEFLAYLWFNQPADNYAELTRKLQKDQLPLTLDSTLERMATSMQPQEIARLSYDPLALTDFPANITSSQAPWAQDPFASSAAELHPHRKGCGEFDQAIVQKRLTAFQRMGHRSNIDFGHQIAGQVRGQVRQCKRRHGIARIGSAQPRRQKVCRILVG